MKRNLSLLLLCLLALVACSTSEKKAEEDEVYVASLGDLMMRAGWDSPSKALEKYEWQLKYRVDDPKQDFLHELNLAGLSLMSGKPAKSRAHLVRASNYIDWQNYTSILNETAEVVLLISIQERYRLQPQEYLMINYLGALTYILENDWKNALVGVRALHESLRRIEQEFPGQRFESLAYFYFFTGYIYEQNNLFDDARIDYEQVLKLNPKWPTLDLHLWRAYEMTGDSEKADLFAAKIGYGKISKEQRRKTAKAFPLKLLIAHKFGWRDSFDLRLSDVHIERTFPNGEREAWGSSFVQQGMSRSAIDREIAAVTPKKMDNPAYLLHVNPYSITYMVLGSIFGAYWEALGSKSKPKFIVNSFEFVPDSVHLLYLTACEADDAKCDFRSYSLINVPHHVVRRKNLFLIQYNSASKSIPFN